MKILALDTSTDACSVALWQAGSTLERMQLTPRAHTDMILPMLEELLAEAGLAFSAVDAIAFGRGPGSFTGVRIATGVVQGLAYARDLPVVPVSTLAALAQGAWRQHQWQQVVSCLDARMQEVYWGAYHYIEGRMQPVGHEACVCAPDQVPAVEGDTWYGSGSGWAEYGETLAQRYEGQIQGLDPDSHPQALDIAVLASFAAEAGEMVSAEQALPVYLRDQVVRRSPPSGP